MFSGLVVLTRYCKLGHSGSESFNLVPTKDTVLTTAYRTINFNSTLTLNQVALYDQAAVCKIDNA